MTTRLETYLPLKEAARKYDVPVETLTQSICAVICGADGRAGIEESGKAKLK